MFWDICEGVGRGSVGVMTGESRVDNFESLVSFFDFSDGESGFSDILANFVELKKEIFKKSEISRPTNIKINSDVDIILLFPGTFFSHT